MHLTVGHSRSTRVTRGELRPFHITLTTTCRVYGSRQYYTWNFPKLLEDSSRGF